ncbi:DoxX-like family protein [Mucilaginibacter phyllosphaerae]
MLKTEQKIHYVLRIAVAMCFIGHGAFGIITKHIWCNYFAVFGIGTETAYKLMPWVGAADIALGVLMLFRPTRAIALWLVIWGIFTAFLRPASGEPFAEFIERAGNFGAPLALLILSGGVKSFKQLFEPIDPETKVDDNTIDKVFKCLKVIGFLLLIGHGWLNLLQKKGLLSQYAAMGFNNPAQVAQGIGVFEITAAFVILIKPVRSILLLFIIWKIASELPYPHYKVFEWIERGGSYGTLIALWFATRQVSLNLTTKLLQKTN